MPIALGQVLADKYRIEASIGKGGMGEVFSASHLGTGKRVAVKVVSRMLLGDLLMQRLHREAIAAGRIQSEFVPQVFDVDRTDEGELFLVMELLRGEPLSERLRARAGVLTWDEVRGIGEDVLTGLIDAHAAGVVHRDLKPGNIFLERVVTGGELARERARVLDFGVAKLDGPDTEKLTTTGESVGTISYMAPEQIRGASKVDERADVYSFGMVAFEALAGRLPYDEQGQVALIASKLERAARPLKDLARTPYPPGLDAVLAKALARKPADRYATAEEMRRAWRMLGAATTLPRPVPLSSLDAHVSPPSTGFRTTEHGPGVIAYSSRASRVALVAAAAVLITASTVLAFALRASGNAGEASATVNAAAISEEPAAVASAPAAASASASASASAAAAAAAETAPAFAAATKPRWRPPRRAPRRPAPAAPRGPHISTEPRY